MGSSAASAAASAWAVNGLFGCPVSKDDLVLAGLAGWTLLEYALHRFVLHGLRPFSDWHAEHHHRPAALICAPTILSASLIAALVFLPAWALGGLWPACAITLGVLGGYLAYAITHHATHHWRASNRWTRQRKRWHALHHDRHRGPGHYGVTTSFWDHLLGQGVNHPSPSTKKEQA